MYDNEKLVETHSGFRRFIYSEHPQSEGYKLTLSVDFLSYYRVILQRLKLYQCDRKLIAKRLTLNKFNNMKPSRIEYMMFLSATAVLLNICLPTWKDTLDYEEWISKFEPIVEETINKL